MQKFILSILLRIFNILLRIFYKIPSKYSNDVNIYQPESLEIKITDKIKYLRIDIGLSDDAAHSVEALLDNDDRMIIGIEPHPKNIEGLRKGLPKHYSVSLNNKYVGSTAADWPDPMPDSIPAVRGEKARTGK